MEIVTALTPARSVSSLSIRAPAAATVVASVTSADVEIPSNFVLSPELISPSSLVVAFEYVDAMVIEPVPFVMLILEPAVSVAFESVFPVVLPMSN